MCGNNVHKYSVIFVAFFFPLQLHNKEDSQLVTKMFLYVMFS